MLRVLQLQLKEFQLPIRLWQVRLTNWLPTKTADSGKD